MAYLLNTYFSFLMYWVLIPNLRWIVNNVCLYLHLLVSQTLFLEDLAWVIYFYSNSSSAGGHDINLRLQVQLYYELMACMHITLYTVFDYHKKAEKNSKINIRVYRKRTNIYLDKPNPLDKLFQLTTTAKEGASFNKTRFWKVQMTLRQSYSFSWLPFFLIFSDFYHWKKSCYFQCRSFFRKTLVCLHGTCIL